MIIMDRRLFLILLFPLLMSCAKEKKRPVYVDTSDFGEEQVDSSSISEESIKSGSKEIGLAEAILNNIKAKFNLNTDHSLDKLKIPFSDPNIYSSILSTFVSNINKKSIKR